MAAKLELSFNSNRLADYQLDKEVITIGRRTDNDIRIENLAVSGHHAKLLTIFNDSFLEDLNSTNGTIVNGKPIDKHPLKHGDIIVIGKHELRYINESSYIGDDDEKTVLIKRPGQPAPFQQPGSQGASNEVLNSAILQILNGKGAGKEIPLSKRSLRLGKSGAEVMQINRRPDGHFIVCLNQSITSPPRVNGTIIGDRAVKLNNHDVIEINRLKIEYYLSP